MHTSEDLRLVGEFVRSKLDPLLSLHRNRIQEAASGIHAWASSGEQQAQNLENVWADVIRLYVVLTRGKNDACRLIGELRPYLRNARPRTVACEAAGRVLARAVGEAKAYVDESLQGLSYAFALSSASIPAGRLSFVVDRHRESTAFLKEYGFEPENEIAVDESIARIHTLVTTLGPRCRELGQLAQGLVDDHRLPPRHPSVTTLFDFFTAADQQEDNLQALRELLEADGDGS